MNVTSGSAVESRRTFCARLLIAGAVGCIGCTKLVETRPASGAKTVLPATGTSFEDSRMSFKEVYDFAFRDRFIPMMLGVSAELGRENLVQILEKISGERAAKEAQDWAKEIGNNDLESWIADLRNPDYFASHVRTWTIIEDSTHVFEVKVTDCLLAETFRAAGAADIGYASFCSGDIAAVAAYNPNIELIRRKTLMQGDECCSQRYVLRDL